MMMSDATEGTDLKPRSFKAKTMAEALDAVRRDLGEGAVIVSRSEVRGGPLGIFGCRGVEVFATTEPPGTEDDRTRTIAWARDAIEQSEHVSNGNLSGELSTVSRLKAMTFRRWRWRVTVRCWRRDLTSRSPPVSSQRWKGLKHPTKRLCLPWSLKNLCGDFHLRRRPRAAEEAVPW